jgi:23S rRNA (pseudouridine1915-N3)-methyltransferase
MKITILAIGKKHDQKLLAAVEDYSKRLSHYTSLEWKLVEAKITNSMSENEIKLAESQVLLNQVSDVDTVVLLDETGTQLNSPALAEKLQNYMNQSVKNLIFIIGGAYGISEEVTKRADFIWSFSKLVFPHQLVRLILVEQLYRAHTILAGEKYHHM